MTIESALATAGFATNPFRIVPPAEMDAVIWAGDRSTINELLEASRSPRADMLATSELVVLFGEFGSGKTNALKYLTQAARQEGALVAYVVRPSIADRPSWHDLVRSFFTQAFRRDEVSAMFGLLRRHVMTEARDRARAHLGEAADANPDVLADLERAKAQEIAVEILPEAPGFVAFAIDLAHDRKDRNWAYLADKPDKALGNEISARYDLPPDGLTTDHGATLLLSSLVRTLTFPTKYGVGAEVVCILLDEMEGLPDFPPASRLSILQGIRELFNSCTEHLFLALAATASDASEMWGIFDVALMQRLSRQPVQFPHLDPSEAKQFLLEVMGYHRKVDYSGPAEGPFSPDGLDAFVQTCPLPLTPRKLLVSGSRFVFQKKLEKVSGAVPLDAADVAEFQAWGAT